MSQSTVTLIVKRNGWRMQCGTCDMALAAPVNRQQLLTARSSGRSCPAICLLRASFTADQIVSDSMFHTGNPRCLFCMFVASVYLRGFGSSLLSLSIVISSPISVSLSVFWIPAVSSFLCVCVCVCVCVYSHVATIDSCSVYLQSLFFSFETQKTSGFGNRCVLKSHFQVQSNSVRTSWKGPNKLCPYK